ncbi:sigma-70 family RNA polymerase sigma factor [Luteolibacter arcticus]|uniref:Sigma-70 family RNA polymerase sigma factor n=1 Tax=Luteolibacter arcticus TaxID=1581411 RepID=A0ABT3GNC9_9BACT|nr:sigma-70 family RNA polymerase sigma factor [Luteolibacter arcticus]MCW1925007.1 sigma-70 family RNA polymerase sigma factor [Luteolibacter arcticus]
MRTDDANLLGLFARERDESAFSELARRHGDLIFHTALRRTGNHAMAEDVSQQVLCALARKAAQLALTTGESGLAPWLHRATIFEASKALRAESSRQRRKELQHPDSMPATGPETSTWEEAMPHLDPALDTLGESDRGVLILHFFRRLSFREIATSTGKSADAVQKQSSRALEKLSRLLRSRGVILPAAVLAAGLTAESAKAAPATLVATLAGHAVSTTAILPLNPLLLMLTTKTKVLVPVVVIACAIPLGLQQAAISSGKRDLAGLTQHPTHSTATADAMAARKRLSRPPALDVGLSPNRDWQTLMEECFRSKTSTEFDAFNAKLGRIPPADLSRLIKEVTDSETPGMTKALFLGNLGRTLAETDPEAACKLIMDAFKGSPSFARLFNHANGEFLIKQWARRDPAAAQTWIESMKRDLKNGDWVPDAGVGKFQLPVFEQRLRDDPESARAWLGSQPPEARLELMRMVLSSHEVWLGEPNPAEAAAYLQYARETATPDAPPHTMLTRLTGQLMRHKRFPDVKSWFSSGQLAAEEKQVVAAAVARLSAKDSRQAPAIEDWLRTTMPKDADRLLQQAHDNLEK